MPSVKLSVAEFGIVGNGSWWCENVQNLWCERPAAPPIGPEAQLERMCRDGILNVLAIAPHAAPHAAIRSGKPAPLPAGRNIGSDHLAESTTRPNSVSQTKPGFKGLATGRRSVTHQRPERIADRQAAFKGVPIRCSPPSKWLQSPRGSCARRRHLE